jgi:hypothetical protein
MNLYEFAFIVGSILSIVAGNIYIEKSRNWKDVGWAYGFLALAAAFFILAFYV